MSREYWVEVTVKLADGEPRSADEYDFGAGQRITISHDSKIEDYDWLAESRGNLTLAGLQKAIDKEKRRHSIWRRIFKRD